VNRKDVFAIVFDMDGLLVDSEPVQIEAWRAFLSNHDRHLTSELLRRLFGLRVWDTARVLIDELGLSMTVEEVVQERDTLFFEMLPGRLSAMPGAVDTVQSLAKSGMRLALATSGHRRYVDVVLGELELTGLFEIEVTGDEVEQGKPAPDIYLAAAERLGVEPSRCVALEDAPNGVASAKAAGMTCLAVPNHMTAEITGFDRADATLSSLIDVIPWLEHNVVLHQSESPG
jgi:HAD superfamily hydrolase (TIGR01509 family)